MRQAIKMHVYEEVQTDAKGLGQIKAATRGSCAPRMRGGKGSYSGTSDSTVLGERATISRLIFRPFGFATSAYR